MILAALGTLVTFGLVYWIDKREHTHKDFFQLLRLVIFLELFIWFLITFLGSVTVNLLWQAFQNTAVVWGGLVLVYAITVLVLRFVLQREMGVEGKNAWLYSIALIVAHALLSYLLNYAIVLWM